MAVQIQIRRDTAVNWAAQNPMLAEGELGLDTTVDKFKIGDGATAWSTLAFQEGSITTVTDNLTSTSTSEALSANQGKVLKTLIDDIPTETTTTLSISANSLTYTDETGAANTIDLSLYLDDTNLARIVSGVLADNVATFTRDDSTTFTVDFSSLLSGKADTDHGTHLTTQDTTDIATGVAHAGSAHAPSDANNYIHPSGDGDLHVPATSTNNSGKVLTAGATAGALTWELPSAGASDLAALTDVDVTTTAPTADQVLKYDGTNWIPGDDVAGSGGTGGTTNLTAGVIWDNHSTTAYDYTNDGVAGSSGTTATDITVEVDPKNMHLLEELANEIDIFIAPLGTVGGKRFTLCDIDIDIDKLKEIYYNGFKKEIENI